MRLRMEGEAMSELVLRNFDKSVLEKLKLSPEDRLAFLNLLRGKRLNEEIHPAGMGREPQVMDVEFGLYNGA